MRIVSLIASSTEIVHALGFGGQLVGRSHECDHPAAVRELPVCTEPKFQLDGTSYEIDQRVKAILQEGLSVYRVHADALDRLKPDLILTQTQCEVCAVSQRDVEEAVCQLVGSRPKIVSLHPNALADVWTDIQKVADALGAPERGHELVRNLRRGMTGIASKVASLKPRPRVAYIEWINPLMAGGNWMPELIALAGGENLFGTAGKHSPFMKWEELAEADPDVILVSPCGFDIARTKKELGELVSKPRWPALRAVRTGRVYLADGNQFFNRPGPRLLDSLEILAEVFHPGVFEAKHRNSSWEPFSSA